jgi:hypothetical protein
MWLSAIKLAVSAGSKIYANKQRAKVAMSDAQLLHAERQARGEEAYQGKLLEARQNDYKDEFVLVILSAPIIVLAWGVFSDDPGALEKVKIFFEHFAALPTWFSTLWILVVGSIFGIKGTQRFNKQVAPQMKVGGRVKKRGGGMSTRRRDMRSGYYEDDMGMKGGPMMKKGGRVGKKKQGYKDRKDESIAMRIKKKRTKKQLKASRDDSYGKFGSKAKKSGKINK